MNSKSPPAKASGKPPKEKANRNSYRPQLFDEDTIEPEWVAINTNGVRVKTKRCSAVPHFILELVKWLGLDDF